jgi:hypothetical protein
MRTDGHEANSRFSQFCERATKLRKLSVSGLKFDWYRVVQVKTLTLQGNSLANDMPLNHRCIHFCDASSNSTGDKTDDFLNLTTIR